ncbi:MAG: hypothetical protein RTU63_11940 [Candidatus Thorarchaeota archaeon]
MSSNQTKLLGVLLVAVLVASAALAALVLFQPSNNTNPSDSFVKVVGTETSQNVTLSDMLLMESITGNSSYQNSYGNVRGEGIYTGVNISDLVDLVGGMADDDVLMISAADGYNQTFERAKVYPNSTTFGIQGYMILAYEFNGSTIPDYEEGFRLAFIPEDGYYTNADANDTTDPNPSGAGPQWVSNVAKIEVIAPPEPDVLTLTFDETTLSFTMSELKALPSINGEGGYRKSSGTINGPFNITGVAFSTLLDLLPTLPANYSLTAIAGDYWESDYSKAIIDGNMSGYTPTGDPLDSIQCTMVLAYELDGSPIPAGDGPLRIAFINADGNLTDGSLWAKYIVNLTITEEPVSTALHNESSIFGGIDVGLFIAETKYI